MKKSALTLAVLALAAGAAQAQSNVQVYGLLDVGIETANNKSATGGSQTSGISGGMKTSRWGLRGSEDLGGGLKAVFNLEGGILMDTGNMDGVLFKRQANIGLEGSFGRVIIGRSFTTVYDTVISFDPMGFAPYYSWAAGEQATGAQDSAKVGFSTVYKLGAVNLMGTWERNNGNTVAATGNRDKNTVWHIGANYETGPFKFWGVVRDYKLVAGKALTADLAATTTWAGLAYKADAATTLTGAIYHINVKNVAAGKDADPTMYVARYRYALSKRTDVFVSAAYVKSKNGQLTGMSRDDAGFGTSQHGLALGMQHRF